MLVINIILFINFLSYTSANFGINLMQVVEESPAENFCTVALLRKYFHTVQPLSGAVLAVSISAANIHLQETILSNIHGQSDMLWSVVAKNSKYEAEPSQTLQEKPQCYFIILENLDDDDLSYVFDDWKNTINWNPMAQFVVLLASVEETEVEMVEMMNEILLSFMSKRIYNVNVIGHSEESYNFYGTTVFPYHPDNNCGTRVIKIETLDICEYPLGTNEQEEDYDEPNSNQNGNIKQTHSTTSTVNIYPDDIVDKSSKIILKEINPSLFLNKFPKDLSGCPLVAAYRSVEPFIFNDKFKSDKNLTVTVDDDYFLANTTDEYEDTNEATKFKQFAGIEYKMLEIIAKLLHIEIKLQAENNNLYHLFQKLLDGDIELLIGGIDEDPSISQYVSSTVAYLQDDLTWCVAKAKNQHRLFNFLESFQLETWLLTLIFVLTTTILVRITQQLLDLQLVYLRGCFAVLLRVFGVILNQSMPIKRLPNALKIVFGASFFLGLIISNVYQSFLISILTTPRSLFQISHLAEIYQYRMAIMGSVENVRHLNKEGEIYKYIRENFELCYKLEECLNLAADNAQLAVAVSRLHSFYNPRIRRDEIFCFDRNENVYVYLVTMLLPKKFHLLHKINPIIQYIIESGHLQKWARDLDRRRKIQDELQRQHEDPFKRITLKQVYGSFVLVGFFLCIASLVFLLEGFVFKMVTKRKSHLKLLCILHCKIFTIAPITRKEKSFK